MKLIPVLKPSCSQAEIDAVTEVLKSGWWGTGPKTAEFEKKFAEYVGSKNCIAVNSCTSALHLAVRILKKRYQEKHVSFRGTMNIVVPSLTFVSTGLVGLYEDLEVRFADINEYNNCMDADSAMELIDEHTIAVIPVHYGGNTAYADYKDRLAEKEWDFEVIEDCAHAAGNYEAGRKGIMSCWSFHPVKNLATGDMGAITTNDDDLTKRLIPMRWCGIDLETYKREAGGYNWEYEINEIGYKYNTNDIMASIALVQLGRLGEMNKRRFDIAERYYNSLSGMPILLPIRSISNHLFVIRVPSYLRDDLVKFLRDNSISPGVHYKPIHHYPIFKNKYNLPVTDKVFSEVLSLPIHADLTNEEQDYIIQKVKEYFGR